MKWPQWPQWPHLSSTASRTPCGCTSNSASPGEQPDDLRVTEGRICECAAMRQMLTPDEFYLGDRNYGADFALFDYSAAHQDLGEAKSGAI